MILVGREYEKQVLEDCLSSGRPEFAVLYGRLRVGKTYLIRQFFSERFSFYATGLTGTSNREKLKVFHRQLREQGDENKEAPEDWFEAFSRLKALLCRESVYREPTSNKKVVFLDELPWMDSGKSDFLPALDFFWNSWGSTQPDILLMVCGSAASWIISNILQNTGGLYNRMTRIIHLRPFSLGECEEFMRVNHLEMSRRQIIESYMVFGGIPYYLNFLSPRLNLAQNVEELCMKRTGQLHDEFRILLSSLFLHHEKHAAVLNALSKSGKGMTRADLEKMKAIGGGAQLTKVLLELEQCDFIRKYYAYGKKGNGMIYQLVDPFTLFCYQFMNEHPISSWISYTASPAYNAWSGFAFEMVCLHHVAQIKDALGIRGIESQDYSWRSSKQKDGAQIDLLIDRKDDVINLCEAKFTTEPFEIDLACERNLIHKRDLFRQETDSPKSLFITLISASGLKKNMHSACVQNTISGDDLFRR
ncbi:MAG: ATP-binding protein [Clostridia bacterium]|nr:ATP-binding protein [Clostridia bacterium]